MFHLRVNPQWDGGKETKYVACQDQIVAAGMRVLDDAAVVELVVDDDEDEGEDDADDADGNHRDIEGHGDRLDV